MKPPSLLFSRLRRKSFRFLPFLRVGLILLLLLVSLFLAVIILPTLVRLGQQALIGPQTIISFLRLPLSTLESREGRVNLVLLGMAGVNHRGAELTDSIIFLSVRPDDGDLVLLSLPRDLWVASIRAKINSAYYYGEQRQVGGGLILAKSAVSEVLGQPVHFGLVIDFAGFEEAIDVLGGLNVEVERAFTDNRYPIPGKENDDCGGDDPEFSCRYETISFAAGPQLMNGEQSLKYARSRNAEGVEGTDYARGQRQQRLLLALKAKLLSPQIFFNPTKILRLAQVFAANVTTDVGPAEAGAFARLALSLRREDLRSGVLDQGDEATGREGLLINPPPRLYDNQWVLTGREGLWVEVQTYIEEFLYPLVN